MRIGGDRFLHERAFDDCLDRLADVHRRFPTALIIGPAIPHWRARLGKLVPRVGFTSDGPLEPASADLCLSVGELESTDDVQAAAFAHRHLLRPGGLLLGTIVGGDSLPRLRHAMFAADRVDGGASPRLHPAIDGPSLAALLQSVGLREPVVDVDRVAVTYPSLDRLVGDLRAMGCTNILARRSRRPISRAGRAAARVAFLDGKPRAIERFDLLHFAAWAPVE